MAFGIIRSLKLKRAASEEHSPQSPLSLSFPLPNTKNCSSIDSLQQSFARTIYIGSMCVITVIISRQLIPWYQNNVLRWSFVPRFLKGRVDWGNLPIELLAEIGKRMVSRLDIAAFRCVCRAWHSSLPSPTRFPLLLPLPPCCDPKYHDTPYAISELNFYCYEPHWRIGRALMQVDQGGIFHLNTTLTYMAFKAGYENAHTVGSPELKYSEISLFAKAYYPCLAFDLPGMRTKRQLNGFPKKLVLISSPNAQGVNPNYASLCDLTVVAHLRGLWGLKGRLALLRLGGPPSNWVWDTDFCSQTFVNIATYKGKLCTLDRLGRVFLMDYNSLQFTLICAPSSIPPQLELKCLFESCGDLYLVDFKEGKRGPVEAYKLSLRPQKWLAVKDLCNKHFSSVCHFLL